VQHQHPPEIAAFCTTDEVIEGGGHQLWVELLHELLDVCGMPRETERTNVSSCSRKA
jgi:hypothetical protein